MIRFYFLASLVFSWLLCFGVSLQAQNFSASGLTGAVLNNPTSLQFGPDGRLYVSQQDGVIKAFTVQKQGATYKVTNTETIATITLVTNHQDDTGAIFNGPEARQVTGILISGTAAKPIIYVTSSDYRIGGGGGGSDTNLDTNSGMVHRLTKTTNGWARLDLVRGLPRSEENHATNGLQLSPNGQTLYIAQGGHTNAGAPSNNFAFTTEYALSGAVLTLDLPAILALPTKTSAQDGSLYKYDLPTLDDPTRPNTGPGGSDVGDPFGGNDGLNQAKLVVGGPVQVYASGFRNLFDLVLTQNGKLYGWDNGPNGGWGGHPHKEGLGTATNKWVAGEPGSINPGPNDGPVNNKDGLHYITGQGYYGGHPNPVRANPAGAGLFIQSGNGGGAAGVWRTSKSGANPLPSDWPPVPASLADPQEGDYQNPGVDDLSLFTVTSSTNGLCEYTSAANGGAYKGDLLAASFNGKLYRIQRNAQGSINSASDVTVLAENFGSVPLDVTAQGDGVIFPGTIWASTYGSDNITVFAPQAGNSDCGAGNSNTIDSDNDGYTNADEFDNNTNPCSQASTPPDFDKTLIGGFKVSDLNDPDDDDDGLNDIVDPFALDATNGLSTVLPLDLPLLNGNPGTGFFGLGFTGLMTNDQDYLLNIADESNSATEIIAGGAVGLFSILGADSGDAYNANNSLKNGFQLGFPIKQTDPVTTLETKLLGPIWPNTPVNYQQAGFALSDGSQTNYLKIVMINLVSPKVQIQYQEADANVVDKTYPVSGLTTATEVALYLEINPTAGTVQPGINTGNGFQTVGPPISLSGKLLATVRGPKAAAVTLLTTSAEPGVTMNATWDYIRIKQATTTPPTNAALLSIDPLSLAFQTQAINTTSQPGRIEISNAGTAVAKVTSFTLTGPQAASFAQTGLAVNNTVAIGGTKNFLVRFTPTSQQPAVHQAQLKINFADGVPSLTTSLSGEVQQSTGGGPGGGGGGSIGTGADLELTASSAMPNPSQWTFADGRFTLKNTGTASATGVSVQVKLPADLVYAGGNEAVVSKGSFNPYQGGLWSVGTMAAGATATIDYRVFVKAVTSQRVDAWVLTQNGTDQDSSPSAAADGEDDSTCYAFNGSGACSGSTGGGTGGGGVVVPTPTPILAVNPSSVALPQTATGQSSSRNVVISNTGNASATVSSVALQGGQANQFAFAGLANGTVISAGSSKTVQVSFNPTSGQSGSKTTTLVLSFGTGITPLSVAVSGSITPTSGGGPTGGGNGGGGTGSDVSLEASATTPNPGQWQIGAGRFTVRNTGNQAATGLKVRVTLPSGLVYQGGNEATASKGSFDPYTTGVWTIGTLAANSAATLDYNVFNKTNAAQKVDAWVNAQTNTDIDSAPSAAPDGEDDTSCFEFKGTGACAPVNGGGSTGSGTPTGTLPPNFKAEAASLSFVQQDELQWTSVGFARTYTNPVVVAHVNSQNGNESAIARIRNVTANGFQVQMEEWEYQNQYHPLENVSYIVMEAGSYDMGSGRTWVAGSKRIGESFTAISGEPQGEYAAFASVATNDDPVAVVVRQDRVNGELQLRLQTEEAVTAAHGTELVHYIMASTGIGKLDNEVFEVFYGTNSLNSNTTAYSYTASFGESPNVLANMQSFRGSDPATMRTFDASPSGFSAFIQEEKSGDDEIGHTTEVPGYFAIERGDWGAGSTASRRISSFNAEAWDRKVQTYWPVQHADQINAYEVERKSSDDSWELLGITDARAGVASVWDELPNTGENVYRLRTLYKDGTYTLSAPQSVEFTIDHAAISVYPNPMLDQFTVYVPRVTEHEVEVKVYNSLGLQVLERSFNDPDLDRLLIDAKLPRGHYRVYITVGGVRKAIGLMVQ